MTIKLSDERVDAMRAEVLGGVDADIQRRGRRGRRVIAGSVGALALATVLGLTIPSLAPSSGDADYVASGSARSAPEAADDAVQATTDGGLTAMKSRTADSAASESYAKDIEPAPIPPGGELTAPGKNREVVTTGSATVTVKSPADSASAFTAWVEKRGGRVDGRSESRTEDGHTSATLVARVPSKYVSAAVAQLRELGVVEAVDLQRDDVTAEGQDLDARIKALEISVKRLEGILERAGSSSEVIEAESALSSRQQELDALKVQRRSLSDQVSLSTLDVTFEQRSKPGAVAPGGFLGGLVKGWNSVVDTVNSVVTAAGVLVPWLAIVGGLALVWWVVRRVRRRG